MGIEGAGGGTGVDDFGPVNAGKGGTGGNSGEELR